MTDTIVVKQQRNVSKAVLSNSSVIASNPAVLYGIAGYNSGPAQFIQLHNSATLPADGSSPVFNIAVAATSNFSIDFGIYGMDFITGISACNSTTAAVKTIGAGDCQFFARLSPT